MSGPEVDDRERIKSTAFNKADNNNAQSLLIDQVQLVADGNATVDKLRSVEDNLLAKLRDSADALAVARTNSAWTNAAIVFALLVAALILMAMVTRSLLHPLRTLRTNALDVAYTKLPETVQRILDDPDPVAASKHAVEPCRCSPARRSVKSPGPSTRCTNRPSDWPPSRRCCVTTSTRSSSTCPGGRRRWWNASST